MSQSEERDTETRLRPSGAVSQLVPAAAPAGGDTRIGLRTPGDAAPPPGQPAGPVALLYGDPPKLTRALMQAFLRAPAAPASALGLFVAADSLLAFCQRPEPRTSFARRLGRQRKLLKRAIDYQGDGASEAIEVTKHEAWRSLLAAADDDAKYTAHVVEGLCKGEIAARRERLREAAVEAFDDKVLTFPEQHALAALAQELGLSAALLDETVEQERARCGGEVRAVRALDDLRDDKPRHIRRVADIAALAEDHLGVVLADVRSAVRDGRLSDWLDLQGVESRSLIDAANRCRKLRQTAAGRSTEEADSLYIRGAWDVLWNAGVEWLVLNWERGEGDLAKRGLDKRSIRVSSLAELRSAAEANGTRALLPALRARLLSSWMRAKEAPEAAFEAAEEAQRGVARHSADPSAQLRAAAKLMWAIGDRSLNLGGVSVATVQELSALDPAHEGLQDAVRRGVVWDWLDGVHGLPKAGQRVDRAAGEEADVGLRTAAMQWTIGRRNAKHGSLTLDAVDAAHVVERAIASPDALHAFGELVAARTFSTWVLARAGAFEVSADADPHVAQAKAIAEAIAEQIAANGAAALQQRKGGTSKISKKSPAATEGAPAVLAMRSLCAVGKLTEVAVPLPVFESATGAAAPTGTFSDAEGLAHDCDTATWRALHCDPGLLTAAAVWIGDGAIADGVDLAEWGLLDALAAVGDTTLRQLDGAALGAASDVRFGGPDVKSDDAAAALCRWVEGQDTIPVEVEVAWATGALARWAHWHRPDAAQQIADAAGLAAPRQRLLVALWSLGYTPLVVGEEVVTTHAELVSVARDNIDAVQSLLDDGLLERWVGGEIGEGLAALRQRAEAVTAACGRSAKARAKVEPAQWLEALDRASHAAVTLGGQLDHYADLGGAQRWPDVPVPDTGLVHGAIEAEYVEGDVPAHCIVDGGALGLVLPVSARSLAATIPVEGVTTRQSISAYVDVLQLAGPGPEIARRNPLVEFAVGLPERRIEAAVVSALGPAAGWAAVCALWGMGLGWLAADPAFLARLLVGWATVAFILRETPPGRSLLASVNSVVFAAVNPAVVFSAELVAFVLGLLLVFVVLPLGIGYGVGLVLENLPSALTWLPTMPQDFVTAAAVAGGTMGALAGSLYGLAKSLASAQLTMPATVARVLCLLTLAAYLV